MIFGMVERKRQKVREEDVTGLKYFDKLQLLLGRLHDVGYQRDKGRQPKAPHGRVLLSSCCFCSIWTFANREMSFSSSKFGSWWVSDARCCAVVK